MYEMLFSCLWSIFYFSLFCSTIVGWKSRSSDAKTDENTINLGAGSAKAIISKFDVIFINHNESFSSVWFLLNWTVGIFGLSGFAQVPEWQFCAAPVRRWLDAGRQAVRFISGPGRGGVKHIRRHHPNTPNRFTTSWSYLLTTYCFTVCLFWLYPILHPDLCLN